MAFLAAVAVVLASVRAAGVSRAEPAQPPDIWEVQGTWVHVTGIKLEFRIDGTYEVTVPMPFLDKPLLRNAGIYDMTDGVIFAESYGGAHLRMEFQPIGEEAARFRFTSNGAPAGELICMHVRMLTE
jgi:hypothetical protein